MKESKGANDSFDEVKIYRPKPQRLYGSKKKIKNASSPSSTSSSSNSDKNHFQYEAEITKMKLTNFEEISLEEINNDFLFYEENKEEEECQNELWDILNNSSEKNFSEKNFQNIPKINRCKNEFYEKNLDYLMNSDINELISDFNFINSNKKE